MRIDQPIKIDILTSGQTKAGSQQPLAGMKAGDVLQVELVEVKGTQVLLKAQDGRMIQADLRGSAQFQPGDILELAFSSRQGSRVSLQMLSLNGQTIRLDVNALESSLIRQGIEPTALNVRLSQMLQQNGYIPTQQNTANLAKITAEQPSLPPSVSTFIAANNIKPDESTLQQLVQWYSGNSPTLENQADSLSQMLRSFSESPASTASAPVPSTSPAPAGIQQTAQAFAAVSPGTSRAAQTAPPAADIAVKILTVLAESEPQLAGKLANTPEFTQIIQQLSALPTKEAQALLVQTISSLPLPEKQMQAVIANLLPVFENIPQEPSVQLPPTPQGPSAPNTTVPQAPAPSGMPTAEAKGAELQATLPAQADSAAQKGPDTSASPVQIAAEAKEAPTALPAHEAARQLLGKLENLFVQLRQDNIAQVAGDLKKAVSGQDSLTESIRSDTLSLSGDKSAATQQAESIRAQVHMTSNLESFFYFQIPVRFEQKQSTAELFIFEKNSSRKVDPQSSTILIALDTENLGRVETVLRADQNDISLDVRLESKALCRYFEDNTVSLKKALDESGFRLKDIKCRTLETKTTLLNAEQFFSTENRLHMGGLDIQV